MSMQGQNNTAGNPLTAVPAPGKSVYSLANGKEIKAIHHFVLTAVPLPLSNPNRRCFALSSLAQSYYSKGTQFPNPVERF